MDMQNVKAALNKNFREFAEAYEKAVAESYQKQLRDLLPGQAAPSMRIADAEDRAAFEAVAREYMSKAEKILLGARAEIGSGIAAAPSTDAVNFVAMMGTRTGTITREEIQAAIDKYGKNYQTYKAIADIARAHGIIIPENGPAADYEWISVQLETLHREYSLANAEAGGCSPARMAFVEFMD